MLSIRKSLERKGVEMYELAERLVMLEKKVRRLRFDTGMLGSLVFVESVMFLADKFLLN